MNGLFWRLFAIFSLAFIAIDVGRSLALRLLQGAGLASLDGAGAAHSQSAELLATCGAALPIALVLSAALSWYLHQPIRVMRRAFSAMSAGRLDTRVRHLLRSRREDIADLGRDFDGMAHRLENLVDLRRRMLRDASHELRSPLARMHTAIGLAQQNPDNMLETLDRIESESLRLQAMLENMLTLAQIESGAEFAAREEVDVAALLAAITDDARFEAQARASDVTLCVSGACIVSAHAELLHRAFENVIRNALKYTAVDTCVDIHAAREGARLRVTVADRGPGVEASELIRIFEPFYRATDARRSTVQGFGVGLAIARRAVEHHGGSIAARNRDGGGLAIEIELPLQTVCVRDC